jgi:holo-[acyl-carrier protein] synthase
MHASREPSYPKPLRSLRSGIDLVEIARLAGVDPAIRERFLMRIFTAQELEDGQDSNLHLAGRFAAKEAVAKALGCGIGPVSWQEIEIRRGQAGEPVLVLYGKAQQIAGDLGLTTWSVSISHTKEYALAMAVACGE